MNPNEALGLPTGSVRAILALMLTVATIVLTVLNGSVPGELAAMASMALGSYFQKPGSPANGKPSLDRRDASA